MMKTRIKNLSFLLVMLGLLPSAKAQFTFTTNNGAITITGYNTAAGLNVVIPAATNGYPVTSIGQFALTGSSATNVIIPDSVTSISQAAIAQCFKMASITIGNGVTNIGQDAFYQDTNLTTVTIPNSVTSIGNTAFQKCSGLKRVTIGNSVTRIGSFAFDYCSALKSVTIPNSVSTLGDSAFSNCSGLTSVTIGNGVTSIYGFTFASCTNLFSVTIPASVTNILGSAFSSASKLTEVYFLGNAPIIAPTAFQGVNSAMTFYHFPNTTGWGTTLNGFPTAITPLLNGVTSVGSLPAVFYPQVGTNYTLQMSTNPASGNWVSVSNTVVFNALQVTNLANTAFFRLQDTSGSVPSPTIVSYGNQPVWIYPTNATYSLQMKTNLVTTNWLAPSGNTFVSVQITNAPAGAVFRLH